MKDLLIDWRQPTPEQKALHGLAGQYHDRCDAYDRAVCTAKSPRSGDVLPADGYELGLVNRNARRVHEDLVRQGAAMGFTEAQIVRAVQEYGKK